MFNFNVFRKYSGVILLIFWLSFFSSDSFAQCSMCRAVVEDNISGKGTGINNGIVYLMIFPYTLVVVLALGMVMKMRKDRVNL